MSRPIARGRWRSLARWWSPRGRAWVCVVSALALALGPLCRRAPIAHAQDTVSTGFIAVTPPNGNPFAQLPKPCWPEHLLIGRDTAYRYAVCRSLDVLPIGMRVRLRCVDSLMVRGGWAKPLAAETVRSRPRQEYLHDQGRTRPGLIVTNVRDARTGFHYWGLAVDLIHPTRYWDHPKYFYWLARHAESCGLVAGGFWKSFPDPPHVQWATIESMSKAPAWAKRLMAEDKRDSLWLMAGATR